MISAAAAKLNLHVGDPGYDRIIEEINAAQDEGLGHFEIDVNGLDADIRLDVVRALFDVGYSVDYNSDEELLEVVYE